MWIINSDKALGKKLSMLSSNSYAAKGYKAAVENLMHAADPARMGERKHGRMHHLYSYRITKSLRLLYFIDRRRGVITLVDLDDHKNLYGKD